MSELTPAPTERTLDLESLKALAHPLRVQILNALSIYGQFTASGLADRFGESSGATSYHLRQLERHGFVREVEGKGTGRERWWERVPGGIMLSTNDVVDTPAVRAASATLMREWEHNRSQILSDFISRGYESLDHDWLDSTAIATANVRLTPEQLAHVVKSWDEWAKATLDPFIGKTPPGSRPVQIHFNAFPIVDGDVTPER
jgi:DNA-binding transcriptional ArsR family regulator